MRHRGNKRRNRPPKRTAPVPGDLTGTPFVLDGPVPSHLIRTDDLQLLMRPNGFTVVHGGRDLTDADVADVMALLGLEPAQVFLTYGRTPGQREYRLPGPQLAPLLEALTRARFSTTAE